MKARSVLAGLLLCAVPRAATAQSAQRFSVQASALYAGLFGKAYTFLHDGFGAEAQLRYTPGGVSIGGGVQWTHHSTDITNVPLTLYGLFVEPRYVIPTNSNTIAPYISMRLSLLKQRISDAQYEGSSSGFTGNAGAGILYRLGARMNLDAGASFGYTTFGALTIRDKTNGTTMSGSAGSGSNLVGRLGLAVGI